MPKDTVAVKSQPKKEVVKTEKEEKPQTKGSVKVQAKDAKNLKPETKTVKQPESKNEKKVEKKTDTDKKKSVNRFQGVERGDAPNVSTAYISGTFNVNLAQKAMMKYVTETLGNDLGSINAKYPYSAVAELVALYIVRSTAKYNKMNAENANLFEVTLENLKRGIRESNEFGSELKSLSENFNPTQMDFVSTFFDKPSVLRDFLEKKAFTNTTNVKITNDALNFVCYMISSTLAMVTRACCVLCEYAKKKNIQVKTFRYACELCFNGEFKTLLVQRLTEIETMFTHTANTDADNNTEDEPPKSSKKEVKKGSKKSRSDSEDDDDDDDDEEDD